MRKFCTHASNSRLSKTVSFQAGRTTGAAVPPASAWSWLMSSNSSLGACSLSNRIQSNPAPAITSALRLLHRLLQSPICGRRSRSARLNALTGICVVTRAVLERAHRATRDLFRLQVAPHSRFLGSIDTLAFYPVFFFGYKQTHDTD